MSKSFFNSRGKNVSSFSFFLGSGFFRDSYTEIISVRNKKYKYIITIRNILRNFAESDSYLVQWSLLNPPETNTHFERIHSTPSPIVLCDIGDGAERVPRKCPGKPVFSLKFVHQLSQENLPS